MPQRPLVLPKGVTLVSKGPPRVLLSDGKRYVEQSKKELHHQSIFIAGDDSSDSLFESMLKAEAESEERRGRAIIPAPAQPTSANAAELANARTDNAQLRSENTQLRSQIEQLQSRNTELSEAGVSAASRIQLIVADNDRLRLVPERVELESMRARADRAEHNLNLFEGALGVRGLSRESVITAANSPGGDGSRESLEAELENEKDPRKRQEIANKLRAWDAAAKAAKN
jgi:hypothetical protein